MSKTTIIAAVAATLAAVTILGAADQPVRDHDITVEDYFTIANILEVSVSPDGRTVAYIENRWEPPAPRRNADLWTVDMASRAIQRLTFDEASESSPAWSPDGRWIYYLAGYYPRRRRHAAALGRQSTQVWRIAAGGGEPQAVTRVDDGVDQFELSQDG